jgi:predicted transcriptional regulator
MNEEMMDKIIEKCKEDPKFAEAFDYLLKASQAAAAAGFTNAELANVATLGWMIGMDPSLAEMMKTLSTISKMGLDIVED